MLAFLSVNALADRLVGVKLGWGELSGDRTDSEYGSASGNVDSEFAAIFVEADTGKSFNDVGISVGLEYIPFKAIVSVDGNSSDSRAELSNAATLYVLGSKAVSGGKVFGKLGYSRVDINAKANYVTTTVTSYDDVMEGATLGLGYEKDLGLPFADVLRFEANYTMYDKVSVTTTSNGGVDTDTRSADVDLATISLSIAKKF